VALPGIVGGAGGHPLLLPAAVDPVGPRRARRERNLPAAGAAGEGHHQLLRGHGWTGQCRVRQCGAKGCSTEGQAAEEPCEVCAHSKSPTGWAPETDFFQENRGGPMMTGRNVPVTPNRTSNPGPNAARKMFPGAKDLGRSGDLLPPRASKRHGRDEREIPRHGRASLCGGRVRRSASDPKRIGDVREGTAAWRSTRSGLN